MMPNAPADARLTPITNTKDIESIIDAVTQVDDEQLRRIANADEIDLLSKNTVFEELEVLPEGIFSSGGRKFEASGTVYITLNYGSRNDRVSIPDSYAAVIRGEIRNDQAEIDEIVIDTTAFYE